MAEPTYIEPPEIDDLGLFAWAPEAERPLANFAVAMAAGLEPVCYRGRRFARVLYVADDGKLCVRFINEKGEDLAGFYNTKMVLRGDVKRVDELGRALSDDHSIYTHTTAPPATTAPLPDGPPPPSCDDCPRRRGESRPPLAENKAPPGSTKRSVPVVSKKSPARRPPPAKVSRTSDAARDAKVLNFDDAAAPPAGPPQPQPPTPDARQQPPAPPAAPTDQLPPRPQPPASPLLALLKNGQAARVLEFVGFASSLAHTCKAAHGRMTEFRHELIDEDVTYHVDPSNPRAMDHTRQGMYNGDETVAPLRVEAHVRALLERNAHYSTIACASAEAMRSVKVKGGDMRFFGLAVNLAQRADGVLESISFTNSIQ